MVCPRSLSLKQGFSKYKPQSTLIRIIYGLYRHPVCTTRGHLALPLSGTSGHWFHLNLPCNNQLSQAPADLSSHKYKLTKPWHCQWPVSSSLILTAWLRYKMHKIYLVLRHFNSGVQRSSCSMGKPLNLWEREIVDQFLPLFPWSNHPGKCWPHRLFQDSLVKNWFHSSWNGSQIHTAHPATPSFPSSPSFAFPVLIWDSNSK